MSEIDEVRARWQGFLKKISERHRAVLDEAEAGCLQLLDLAELETNPMVNAWQGVSSQLMGLTAKIQDTWDDKVAGAFEEAYESADLDGDADEEFAPGEKLVKELDAAKARREADIFGKAADKLLAAAKEQLAKSFACTQCSAPLPVRGQVFRSYYLPCEACETVNTFEPGTRVRSVEHFCAHYLAMRHAVDLELAMQRKWDEVKEHRSAPLELLKELEKAVEAYWTAYYDKRAEIAPAYLKDRTKDIGAKMRAFYVEMGREDNWQAEGTDARFNQERIVRHLEQIGASIAAAGEYPEDVYTHFMMVYDEDAIKEWLKSVWEERLAAQVHAYYEEDLALYRQLMPTPLRHLFEGFASAMGRYETIIKRSK